MKIISYNHGNDQFPVYYWFFASLGFTLLYLVRNYKASFSSGWVKQFFSKITDFEQIQKYCESDDVVLCGLLLCFHFVSVCKLPKEPGI